MMERRKIDRYKVKDASFVILKEGQVNEMAQLVDISEDGLGCYSVTDEPKNINNPLSEIILADNGFCIEQIPLKKVSAIELSDNLPLNLKKMRYGLQFSELTAEQRSKLLFFIRNHTS
jgi:hypothetical protein